jgi:dTDP-D-glucose 4,6-dehydratase
VRNQQQALTGEPITIYGDGSQSRSFCCVDDLGADLRPATHDSKEAKIVRWAVFRNSALNLLNAISMGSSRASRAADKGASHLPLQSPAERQRLYASADCP